MVFYRKYRPQKISELDSTKVRETLTAVLSNREIPHAFLFTGPKGLGKTSTARIIAKVVNCLHGSQPQAENRKSKNNDNFEPDNTCEQCVSITNGTNIDVLEIDGASNRGIDEIRDLRERVKLAPSSAKKKVYIIDEVHMLTTEAFNALLKTIEEPPPHVMFIFCTTEPHKVPATIISRCFHIEFSRATDEEIVHSLERIVVGEKIEIESKDKTEILSNIAKSADGGFRDASKILEEIVLMSDGKKITKEKIEKVYKNFNIGTYLTFFLLRLKENKIKAALDIVTEVTETGIDMKFFIGELLESFHAQLLKVMGVLDKKTFEGFSLEQIKDLINLFTQAYQETKYSVIPQLPLEMAIITWGEMQKENNKNPQSLATSQISKIPGKPNMESLAKHQQSLKVKSVLYPEKEEKKVIPTPTHKQNDISSAPDENTALMENLIYKVKPYNHSVAGILRGCKVKEVKGVEIVFETPYKFHKERLEESKTCEIIAKAVKEITGKSLKVTVQLKK